MPVLGSTSKQWSSDLESASRISTLGTQAFPLDQVPDLSGKITGKMLLEDGSGFWIGAEILLECLNPPTHGAHWFDRYRIYISRDAVEDEGGTDQVSSDQFAQYTPVFRDPHFSANDQRNTVGKLPLLDQAFADIGRDPRSNAQNPKDFPRR